MRSLPLALLLALSPAEGLTGAQDPRPAEPPLPDAKAARAQGLVLSFDGADARPVRIAALRVPEGTAPSPFRAPGPFTAAHIDSSSA